MVVWDGMKLLKFILTAIAILCAIVISAVAR